MTELSFTKSFLSLLDSRPLKRQSDWSLPPQKLELHAPYTLPRMPTPMRKLSSSNNETTDAPSSSDEPRFTILLKSSRPPPDLNLTLPDIDIGRTSVLDLKQRVATTVGLKGTEKVKVLYARKPVGDSKTVREVLGGEEGVGKLVQKWKGEVPVEFGVMVMGGLPTAAAAERGANTSAAPGRTDVEMAEAPPETGAQVSDAGTTDILEGDAFWDDLKGYLTQRIKDEYKAVEVWKQFKASWQNR